MRLLVFTQALDRKDPVLGAYHRLVAEIACNFDSVLVVCLKKGDYDLPRNVDVLSLGKEEGRSRLKYVARFYRYVFAQRYDAVFVHMNQEYVLMGGIFWKLFRKKVYLWRNHHAGSWLTDLAAVFCTKVFCTSKFSYTAKYRKAVLMPVGIDTNAFRRIESIERKPRSVLFLARMAPVKKPHVLIRALASVAQKKVDFSAALYGDPLPVDAGYYESLKRSAAEAGLSGKVSFLPGMPNEKTPEAYNAYEIFVNLSSSGMYDKTIFEAMACETLAVATNRNLEGQVDPIFVAKEDDVADIAAKIEALLSLDKEERDAYGKKLRAYTQETHSLAALGARLAKEVV